MRPVGRIDSFVHHLGQSFRVLVVDDEPTVRRITKEFLELDGHVVTEAESGAAGLEALRDGAYDLVVTDRAMPGVNGDQIAAYVKQSLAHTRVILLTGFGDIMTATGEVPPGVDAILSKPASLTRLRKTIQAVM